jgi:hypothetical protein
MPGRQRNRSAVLAGLVLVVVCGGLGTALYASAGRRQSVLAVTQEVPAGTQITDADLGVARVGTDHALRPVPASLRSKVVGRVARVGLVPGTLITPADLAAPGAGVPAGQSVVALLLHFGQAPPLAAGDGVLVVAPAQGVNAPARVFAVEVQGGGSQDLRVSLLADSSTAAQIASVAAANGQISVVLRSTGP